MSYQGYMGKVLRRNELVREMREKLGSEFMITGYNENPEPSVLVCHSRGTVIFEPQGNYDADAASETAMRMLGMR